MPSPFSSRPAPARLLIAACAAMLTLVASGCGAGSTATDDDARPGANGGPGAGTKRTLLPPDTGDVEVRVLASTVRITPRIDLDGAPESAQIDIARGEREGVQLAAFAPKGRHAVTGIGVAGDLATTPGLTVRTYVERAVTVERGSPAGSSGIYYDALVPSAAALRDVPRELEDDARLFVWVDVDVGVTVAPGTVSGLILVRDRDGVAAQAALTVIVRQPTLPDRPTMESSVGIDANQLARLEDAPEGTPAGRAMLDRYFAELAAARLSTADPGALLPGTLPGARVSAADEQLLVDTFTRRGASTFRVPLYTTYPFRDPLGLDRAATVDYLRRVARDLRTRGWLEHAYVYLLDEPDVSEAGDVRELVALVHEADPDLRVLLTSGPRREFDPNVDIWVPNVSRRFAPEQVAVQARRGNETWWYPSISTYRPWPTLFIDDLRPSPRALGWLAWQRSVTGLLYWSATHWHEVDDPYRDPATYNDTNAVGNGDGVLLYPGRPVGVTGPVPSVRLLQLRDGIEDHDLLTMAACAGTTADRARLRAAALAAAPSLTSVPNDPLLAERLRGAAFGVLDRAAARGSYDPASRTVSCARQTS